MIALLAFVVEDVVDQIILTIEKIALVTITNVALLAIYRSNKCTTNTPIKTMQLCTIQQNNDEQMHA